ncbi:MAG TPA: methyl-accepting chemotaxis protein [Bacteroidales bacterium]|nr:methyl-accepting chemotaxis protein [Bacteroidales bacterium]
MLNNIKIRSKLLVGFLSVALIAGIIGLFSIQKLRTIDNSYTLMYQTSTKPLGELIQLAEGFQRIRINVRDMLMAETDELYQSKLSNVLSLNDSFDTILKTYESSIIDEQARKLYDELIKAKANYMSFLPEFKKYVENGQKVEARALMNGAWLTSSEKYQASMDNLVRYNIETAGKTSENNGAAVENTITLVMIIMSIAVIISILLGLIIASNIQNIIKSVIGQSKKLVEAAVGGRLATRANAAETNAEFREIVVGFNQTLDAVIEPLNVAANYVERISRGDIPQEISDNYNGDFNNIKENLNILIRANREIIEKAKLVASGDLTVDLKKRSENDELMQSLTEMVKSTGNIISEFKTASDNISASSQQMSTTSQEMSQGASEQASSAEEVSSSMEEMSANIQQNTENAQQTEKIALNAAEGISRINEAAALTLKHMTDIADKVSIIGEIARQTNILALNAAVEAARAGEHGKGFAVVAAEVRKLAERSQLSAVEIESLTKNSVIATEEATRLLSALAPEIEKTAKLVQEIAAASTEQNSGAEQVNNAIQQLNQVTQQNAAASEEMATSSEELASQAQQLLDMISYFKVGNQSVQKKTITHEKNKTQVIAHIPKADKVKQNLLAGIPKKGISLHMEKDVHDTNFEKF